MTTLFDRSMNTIFIKYCLNPGDCAQEQCDKINDCHDFNAKIMRH